MVKQKADIFIVVEYVVNWFDANSYNNAPTKIPEGIANRLKSGDKEVGSSSVAESIINQGSASQQVLPLVQSTAEAANGTGAPRRVMSWPE